VGLLDRYLAKEILIPFAAGLLFLTQILLATQLLSQAEILFGSGVALRDVGVVLVSLMPHFLGYVLPVAFLLGAVLGVGRLSEDREVIAMGAAGLSPVRLVRVPLALGVATALVAGWISLYVEPMGLREARLRLNEIVKRNVMNDVRPGTFFEDIPGYVLYTERVQGGRWQNVLIHDRSSPSAPILALAHAGRLEAVGEGEEMRLVLEDGEIHREEAGTEQYVAADFERAQVSIGLGQALSDRNALARNARELTVAELLERARPAPGRSEADRLRNAGYLHRKISTAMSIVAFALLAVPLATGRRSGRAFGVLVTILAVVAQYLLMRSGEVLAQRGALPPGIALQLSTVVLSAAGLVMIALLARRGSGAVR